MPQETQGPDVLDELLRGAQLRQDTPSEAFERGLGNVAASAGAIPAGAVEFLGIIENKAGEKLRGLSQQVDMLQFLDPIGEDLELRGEMLRKGGQIMGQAAAELIDAPESQAMGGLGGFLSQDFASGLGSIAPLLAFGGAPALGMIMSATSMGAQEFVEQEARDPDNEGKQWAAMLGGLALGATEMVPVSRMLTRINQRSGGQLKKLMVDRVLDGGEEAIQEMFQTLGSNAIAKFIGEEDRDLAEGVLRAGAAGGAVALFTGIAGSRVNKALGRRGEAARPDFTSVDTATPGGVRDLDLNVPRGTDTGADPRSVDSAPVGSLPELRETGGEPEVDEFGGTRIPVPKASQGRTDKDANAAAVRAKNKERLLTPLSAEQEAQAMARAKEILDRLESESGIDPLRVREEATQEPESDLFVDTSTPDGEGDPQVREALKAKLVEEGVIDPDRELTPLEEKQLLGVEGLRQLVEGAQEGDPGLEVETGEGPSPEVLGKLRELGLSAPTGGVAATDRATVEAAPPELRQAVTESIEVDRGSVPERADAPEGVEFQEEEIGKVFHGTAASFDEFSDAFIGTGEGAQAFGHGLYFASRKGIARFYQQTVGGAPNTPFVRAMHTRLSAPARGSVVVPTQESLDRELPPGKVLDFGAAGKLEVVSHSIRDGDTPWSTTLLDKATGKEVTMTLASGFPSTLKGHKFLEDNGINLDEEGAIPSKGLLKTVFLTPKPSEMIDLDTSLGNQSRTVREGIRSAAEEAAQSANRDAPEALDDGANVSNALTQIKILLQQSDVPSPDVPRALSALLLRHGIKGNSYLDALSRGTESTSRNFVIFDVRDIAYAPQGFRSVDTSVPVEPDISDGTELLGPQRDPLAPIRQLLPQIREQAPTESPAEGSIEAEEASGVEPTQSPPGDDVAADETGQAELAAAPQEGAGRDGVPAPSTSAVEAGEFLNGPAEGIDQAAMPSKLSHPPLAAPPVGALDAKTDPLDQADLSPEDLSAGLEAGKDGDSEDIRLFGSGLFPLVKLPGWEAVKRFAGKNLRPRGDRPEVIDTLKRRSENWFSGQMERVKIVDQDLRKAMRRVMKKELGRKVSEKELAERLDRYFKDAGTISGIQDPELRGLIRKMRDHVDLLTRRMIQEGVVEGSMAVRFAENEGSYATRTFRVHTDPKYLEGLDPDVRNRFKSFLRSEYITTRRQAEIQKRFDESAERQVKRLLQRSGQRKKRLEGVAEGETKQILERERRQVASLERLARNVAEASPDSRDAVVAEFQNELDRFETNVENSRRRLEESLADPDLLAVGPKEARSRVAEARKKSEREMSRIQEVDKARLGVLRRIGKRLQDPTAHIEPELFRELEKADASIQTALRGVQRRLFSKLGTEAKRTQKRVDATRVRGKERAAARIKKESAPVAEGMTDAELDGFINSILRERMPDGVAKGLNQRIGGAKQLGTLKRRRELSDEWLELLGENRNVRINYVQSVANNAQLIANHRYLTQALEAGLQGGFFQRKPTVVDGVSYDARIAAEGNPSLAPLDGIYTTKEIKDALTEQFAQGKEHWLVSGVLKANGFAKLAKTVLSAMTHVRNYVSNGLISAAHGHLRPFKVAAATASSLRRTGAKGGIRDSFAGGITGQTREEWEAAWTRASELGVVASGAASGEVRKVVEEVWGDANVPAEYMYGNKMKLMLRAGVERASAFYQLGDDAWKFNGYGIEVQRMRKAFPDASQAEVEQMAADRILEGYTDYSKLPELVQLIRKLPVIGAFVAFPTEIVRITHNLPRRAYKDLTSGNAELRKQGAIRLAGTLAAFTIPETIAMVSRILNNMDAEDDENLRLFVAPWSKESTLVWTGVDEEGNPTFIDFSYVDPFAYVKKPFMAMLRGVLSTDEDFEDAAVSALSEAAEPWIGEDILFGAVVDTLRNKKSSGGRVYDEAATWDDKVKEIGLHIANAVEPGTVSSIQRIMKGYNDEVSTYGRKFDFEDEMISVFSGQRITTIDIKGSLGWRASDFNRDWTDSTQTLSQGLKVGTTTMEDDDIRDLYERTERQRRQSFRELYRASLAAQSLGLTADDVIESLESSGMSKKRARSVVDGRYEPYMPSKSFMKSAMRRTTTNERALEFRRRVEVLEDVAAEAEPMTLPED